MEKAFCICSSVCHLDQFVWDEKNLEELNIVRTGRGRGFYITYNHRQALSGDRPSILLVFCSILLKRDFL